MAHGNGSADRRKVRLRRPSWLSEAEAPPIASISRRAAVYRSSGLIGVRRRRLLAILSMTGACLAGGMGSARAAGVTRNFETNSLSGLRVSGNAPSVQGSIKRLGRYGMRSYLNRSTSAVSYRTEARAIVPDPIVNQEYWYGFSIYLPDDYVPDTVWEIVAQWHGIPTAASPTVILLFPFRPLQPPSLGTIHRW